MTNRLAIFFSQPLFLWYVLLDIRQNGSVIIITGAAVYNVWSTAAN